MLLHPNVIDQTTKCYTIDMLPSPVFVSRMGGVAVRAYCQVFNQLQCKLLPRRDSILLRFFGGQSAVHPGSSVFSVSPHKQTSMDPETNTYRHPHYHETRFVTLRRFSEATTYSVTKDQNSHHDQTSEDSNTHLRRLVVDGRSAMAVYVAEEMIEQNITPDISILCQLSHTLSTQVDSPEQCRRVMQLAAAAGHKPTLALYHSLIRAYANANDAVMVLACVDELKNVGLVMQDLTYEYVISACANAGHTTVAVQYREEMRVAGCLSDPKITDCVVGALFKQGKRQEAISLIEQCSASEVNQWVIAQAMENLRGDTRMNDALRLMHFQMRSGFKPTRQTVRALLNIAAQAHNVAEVQHLVEWTRGLIGKRNFELMEPQWVTDEGARGNTESAVQWIAGANAAGCKPSLRSYVTAIKAFRQKRDVQGAEEWFQRMRDAGFAPPADVFHIILAAWGYENNPDAAERWFNRMAEFDIAPSLTTLNTLIAPPALPSSAVLRWVAVFHRLGIAADIETYNLVLRPLAREGRLKECEELFDRVIAGGIKPTTYSYTAMMVAALAVDDHGKARGWYRRLCAAGLLPDAFTRGILTKIRWGNTDEGVAKASVAARSQQWKKGRRRPRAR